MGVPKLSTLRRAEQKAFAKTPTRPASDDFSDSEAATTKIMTHDGRSQDADADAISLPVRGVTLSMMVTDADIGVPPEMPQPRAAQPIRDSLSRPPALAGSLHDEPAALASQVEDPTHMPHPLDIPVGVPTNPAAAPGLVPRGDSRSMRLNHLFALVYRLGTFVVSRAGDLGRRGVWRVIEYPTSQAASNAYARECSRWVDAGYTDYRG